MAGRLTKLGIPTKAYHAGLHHSVRDDVQSQWTNGQTPVIAATISFGMGIDKANVRSVILVAFSVHSHVRMSSHVALPATLLSGHSSNSYSIVCS